jgi:DNA-nicking Smr family endonuclease
VSEDEGPFDGDPTHEPSGEAVVLPVTGEIDLHTFAPRDVPSVVEEYLVACREHGLLDVRLVHGRGTGAQRAVVRRLLASLAWVESFRDAAPHSGGWGATVATLRPIEENSTP